MNEIVIGSLADIANRENMSIAETFLNAEAIIIVDTSGSMDICDSRGNERRYEVACQELADLQAKLPGKLAVIAFSNYPTFVPHGVPPFLGGMTDLAGALDFARIADDIEGMRFIVISDGEPQNEQAALDVARTYKNTIDVVYVGPEENAHSRAFLERLASIAGGSTVTCDRVKELSSGVMGLLEEKV